MLNFVFQKILNVIKAERPDERVNVKFVKQMNTSFQSASVTIRGINRM